MSNNTSWALSEKGRDYSQAIDPFKAVYALRKQIPGSSSRFCHTEGIACSVFVEKAKKKTICVVTFSDVAKNIHCDQTLTQLHRFSRKHEYRVPTGLTVKRFDRFSFLSMDRDIVRETGINFEVIGLTFRAPKKEELTSNLEAYSFIGSKKLKLKLEFQGNNKKHKLVRSEKDEFVDKYCVIGAPIIVENEEIKSSKSGRWSVLGVVGLSEEGALCPYFVTNEIFEQEMSVHSSDEEVINDTTGQPAPISGVLQPRMSQTNHDASRPLKKVDEHEVDASDCRRTDAEDQISVHNTQDGVFLDEQGEAGGVDSSGSAKQEGAEQQLPAVTSGTSNVKVEHANAQKGKRKGIQHEGFPEKISLRGPLALEAHSKALSKGKTRVRRIPVMLIGQDRSGKTSLKKSLRGIRFSSDEGSTVGIDVDPSYFKVTTEIWKTGEADKKDATSYEQHAGRLVVNKFKKGEFLVTLSANTESDEFPLDKQLDGSRNPGASRVPDSDDDSNVFNTSADQRTDFTNRPYEVETLIKKLLQEVNKVKDEDDIYSVLWDFGGRSVYDTIYPVFLTSRALYLLVHDLSRDPYKPAQPVTKQGMYKTIQDSFETKSNLDYLDFGMTSIASLASQDSAHTKESDLNSLLPEKLPPVFLVCTNADRPCGGAEPFALAREVYGYLQGKSYKNHLCDDVFVVDNTKSGGESECPEMARLRQSILAVAKELPLIKEDIPVKWFKYERALQLTLGEGHKWIYLQHAKRIAAEVCEIRNDREFLTLLKFLHYQRILIHFDDTPESNKLVVLDLQWLGDVFNKVITVQPSDCHGKAVIKQLWHKLETEGILEEKLLKHVWDPLIKQHETYESFIAIMEKFSLLCSWPSSDTSCNKQYLVPSMLMSHPPQDITELIASAELPSLFLKLEPGQVPRSLFPRLVLQFFQWGQNEFLSSLHPQLYKNFARFYTAGDEDCSVILLCHSLYIEVVVHRGNVNPRLVEGIQSKHDSFEVFCARTVYRQLSLMLDCMREQLRWSMNIYQAGFICPVCCHRKLTNYCRTHRQQYCEQEECLHFLSESELHRAKQFITCTRAAAAVDNKVDVKYFSAWCTSPSEQTATNEMRGRWFPSCEGIEEGSHAQLPGDVVESPMSRSCDPKEMERQLKDSLHLDEKCLEQLNPETKITIRYLAKRAKELNRIEVFKFLREITPAGTTGPLLPGNLDIRSIPVRQMRELTIYLSGGEEWKDVAEKLGLTSKEIRFLDKRILNPCDAALAFVSQRCHINVDDLYDVLTECGYPVLADTL